MYLIRYISYSFPLWPLDCASYVGNLSPSKIIKNILISSSSIFIVKKYIFGLIPLGCICTYGVHCGPKFFCKWLAISPTNLLNNSSFSHLLEMLFLLYVEFSYTSVNMLLNLLRPVLLTSFIYFCAIITLRNLLVFYRKFCYLLEQGPPFSLSTFS